MADTFVDDESCSLFASTVVDSYDGHCATATGWFNPSTDFSS